MIKVGQKLYEARLKKGLSLDEVAKATKIRSSFLSAIEKGEYQKLPSGAYIQGFVKNYAAFLDLPQKEFAALFRREFNEQELLTVLPEGFTKNNVSLKRIHAGQTFFAMVVLLVFLVGFLVFQYRYSFINPPLSIASPQEGQVAPQTLTVYGKTDPNATVFVNENLISVSKDGSFQKMISVFPGKATIKIKAVNRFGRQTEIDRHVEVKGASE